MTSQLFQPTRVGALALAHRVVLAPLTRLRADARGVHGALAAEHYAQRAGVRGTLLVTEATAVARFAEGRGAHSPGVWRADQVAGWKRVSGLRVLSVCCVGPGEGRGRVGMVG